MEEIIFPNQIRMYRRIRNVGMQQLADYLGISLSAVSKIERATVALTRSNWQKSPSF